MIKKLNKFEISFYTSGDIAQVGVLFFTILLRDTSHRVGDYMITQPQSTVIDLTSISEIRV